MRQASFSIGKIFFWHGKRHVILSIIDGNQVVLELEHNVFANTTLRDLETAYSAGEISFTANAIDDRNKMKYVGTQIARRLLTDFSEATQRHSFRANAYLTLLLGKGAIKIDRSGIILEQISEVALLIGDACPPHPTTVFRWNKKFLSAGGDRNALIYRFEERGGKGKPRCTIEESVHQDKLIDTIYLTRNGPGVDDLAKQMELDCKRTNQWRIESQKIKPRSTASFRRRISQYDPFDVVAARQGIDEARRQFKHNRQVPATAGLLDLVEIDHTPFDLFVYDLENGIPLGRPTLTLALCRKSKMPWGFNIGFDDCSTEAVLACIAHGIKPKTYVKTMYPEVKNDWNVYGIPSELRCDNGQEFHSKALKDVAKEFCFEVTFCPKHQPNWKGSIESFLKTINYQLAHKLPGTTFSKYWKRKDYDPLKAAAISLEELTRIVHVWLVDIYMCNLHRGLECTPNQAWHKEYRSSAGYLPYTVQEIDIICNTTEYHPIWRYGVELNGRQKYNSDALGALRSRLGVLENGKSKSDVKIKVIQKNIGHIWVFDSFENVWFMVPNVRADYAAGLSLYQHRLIKKFLAQQHRDSADYDVLLEAKEWIRQHTAKLQSSINLSDRKRAVKIAGQNSPNPARSSSQTANEETQNEDPAQVAVVVPGKNIAIPLKKSSKQQPSSSPASQEDDYEIIPIFNRNQLSPTARKNI